MRGAVVLGGHDFPKREQEGLGRRERRHLGEALAAQGLALLSERAALGVGEAQALGAELCAQHTVLGAKVETDAFRRSSPPDTSERKARLDSFKAVAMRMSNARRGREPTSACARCSWQ
jgi:hypothetical protein